MISKTIELPINEIVCQPQVREHFDEEPIAGFAKTIGELGLLQPILVRRDGNEWVLINGEMRLRAAKKAGLTKIRAEVEDSNLTAAQILHRQLVANQHIELLPLEKARAIDRLMRESGWTAIEVAAKLGISSATVSRLLSLLKLPESVQEKIDKGQIPASTAYELAKVEDAREQAQLADDIAAGRLTRDGVSGRVKAGRTTSAPSDKAPTRGTAALGGGRSITVRGSGLSLENLIAWLEELLAKARKARPQGLELTTFLKMLRDQANA